MRTFDNFERNILTRIKQLIDEGLDISFIALLDGFIEHKGFKLDFEKKRAFVLFDSLRFSRLQGTERMPQADLVSEVKQLNEKLVKIIILVNYLEKEGYLFRLNAGKSSDTFASYARITNDVTPITHELTDQKLVNLISEYFNNYFYVSQGLVDNISAGFSHSEADTTRLQLTMLQDNLGLTKQAFAEGKKSIGMLEKSLKETQILIEDGLYISHKGIRYSDIALAMAILLGVIGTTIVGISTYLTFNTLESSTKKINGKLDPLSKRIETIEENFSYISSKLDNITIKDTIHTKLVHFPQDTVYTKVVNHVKIEDVTKRNRSNGGGSNLGRSKGVNPLEP